MYVILVVNPRLDIFVTWWRTNFCPYSLYTSVEHVVILDNTLNTPPFGLDNWTSLGTWFCRKTQHMFSTSHCMVTLIDGDLAATTFTSWQDVPQTNCWSWLRTGMYGENSGRVFWPTAPRLAGEWSIVLRDGLVMYCTLMVVGQRVQKSRRTLASQKARHITVTLGGQWRQPTMQRNGIERSRKYRENPSHDLRLHNHSTTAALPEIEVDHLSSLLVPTEGMYFSDFRNLTHLTLKQCMHLCRPHKFCICLYCYCQLYLLLCATFVHVSVPVFPRLPFLYQGSHSPGKLMEFC